MLACPAPPTSHPGALLINGTVGAGKTAVADMIGDLLTEAAVPNAVVDLDWLRRSWPSPPDDPFNVALTLANLRAVARNFRDAGAVRLTLAGVIEDRAGREAHRAALGIPLAVCRLTVDLAVVRDRLIGRHVGDESGLRWHLHRAGELDDILATAGVDDFTVDATDRSVHAVAADVISAAGWDRPT